MTSVRVPAGSENEHPRLFPADQLFLVLEYSHAGIDLENFQFRDVEQAVAAFYQVRPARAACHVRYSPPPRGQSRTRPVPARTRPPATISGNTGILPASLY